MPTGYWRCLSLLHQVLTEFINKIKYEFCTHLKMIISFECSIVRSIYEMGNHFSLRNEMQLSADAQKEVLLDTGSHDSDSLYSCLLCVLF